jgi:hypothetical protein
MIQETLKSSSRLSAFFMVRGYMPFALGGLLYVMGVIFIVSVVPRIVGLVILFTLLLDHFWSATSWLVYDVGYSTPGQNIVDLAIAFLITMSIGKAKEEA